MRPYRPDDFTRIRDFLVETYARFGGPHNWMIDRWNFAASVSRTMHGVSEQTWASEIAIWEDAGSILAVVNAEGEQRGEVFFQLPGEEPLPYGILVEMFLFCEDHLGIKDAERETRTINLRIHVDDDDIQQVAAERGFTRHPHTARASTLLLDHPIPVKLPDGFTFAYGDEIPAADKANAHAEAFGYEEEALYVQRARLAFQRMTEMPDYCGDLDLHVLSPEGEVVTFATGWHDRQNRIGILEPLGTVPRFRRLGLAQAAVGQLANQLREAGAEKFHVGSDQPFYFRMGFEPHDLYGIWVREMG